MISERECITIAGLTPSEAVLGARPSSRHDYLLKSYLSISKLSKAALRDVIISDLRGFMDLGAEQQAADRLMILRRVLSDYPQALPRRSAGRMIVRKGDGIRGVALSKSEEAA